MLLGAVGGPKWDGGPVRPEAGLIGLRRELDVYANLRPAVADGIDLLIVRELVGGLYYGARGTRDDGTVFDTCEYHPSQVERVARRAFELARGAQPAGCSRSTRRTCSTPRGMWRRVVTEVAADYPDVELRHGLVDSVAMQIVTDPESVRRARDGEHVRRHPLRRRRRRSPAGSASPPRRASATAARASSSPCTARRPTSPAPARANPTAMLRSLALLLEHGLGEPDARAARSRRRSTRARGRSDPDVGGSATTSEFGDAVLALAAPAAEREPA